MANAYVSSDFDDKYFSIHKDFYESYDVTTKPCADNFEICDDLFEKDPYMCHEYTSDSDDVDNDVAEEKRIQTFFKNGCRCEFGSSKTQCSDFISVKVIEDLRYAMQEALREEKDMAILSYFVQTRLPLYAMSDDEKVKLQHCSFNLFGQRVCCKSFLFAYDIGIEKNYFLLWQYDINGAVPHIHGNKKRLLVHKMLLALMSISTYEVLSKITPRKMLYCYQIASKDAKTRTYVYFRRPNQNTTSGCATTLVVKRRI